MLNNAMKWNAVMLNPDMIFMFHRFCWLKLRLKMLALKSWHVQSHLSWKIRMLYLLCCLCQNYLCVHA